MKKLIQNTIIIFAIILLPKNIYANVEKDIADIKSQLQILENKLNAIESRLGTGDASNSSAVSNAPEGPKAEPKTEMDQKNYDYALSLLKDGRMEDAEKMFFDLMQNASDENLKGKSYFWYAETFFARKIFDRAAAYYTKCYKNFPKGPKAADALLKLALSLGEINKVDSACDILDNLDLKFPSRSSTAKKRALEARNKFGCMKKKTR